MVTQKEVDRARSEIIGFGALTLGAVTAALVLLGPEAIFTAVTGFFTGGAAVAPDLLIEGGLDLGVLFLSGRKFVESIGKFRGLRRAQRLGLQQTAPILPPAR